MANPERNNVVFRLAPGVRIQNQTQKPGQHPGGCGSPRVLLAPEKFYLLELSEAAILELCRGEVPFDRFPVILGQCFEEEVTADFTRSITNYLDDLMDQRLVTCEPSPQAFQGDFGRHLSALEELFAEYATIPAESPDDLPIPRLLLAELTHRCPLHCPYCSNPMELIRSAQELATKDWIRAFNEASELGVLHVGFSGGEPLVRADLPELVAAARGAGLYTNLVTSGIGLTPVKARQLKDAGLDSIQISFQAEGEILADLVAGLKGAHRAKLEAARIVKELGIPLALNIVLHRKNIDGLEQIIELADELGAQHLELANVQFYGWAFKNRDQLLPTRLQVQTADALVQAAQARLRSRMEIIYVLPDYFGTTPKPCMQGWGRRYLTINPRGDVLPCPTASAIPDLRPDNVSSGHLAAIWRDSEAFNRFRGTAWMPEPCRTCDLRFEDFGGCRCQAALIAGDASFTDPACFKSPYRNKLTEILDRQILGANREDQPFVYRSHRSGLAE